MEWRDQKGSGMCGRGENATVTAYCFGLLDGELRPLKRAEAEGGLLPQARTLGCALYTLHTRCSGNRQPAWTFSPLAGLSITMSPALVRPACMHLLL